MNTIVVDVVLLLVVLFLIGLGLFFLSLLL